MQKGLLAGRFLKQALLGHGAPVRYTVWGIWIAERTQYIWQVRQPQQWVFMMFERTSL